MTRGDLKFLAGLLRRDLRERQRRYALPAQVERRQRYFEAHPGAKDVNAHGIALAADLLARMEAIPEDAAVVVVPNELALAFLFECDFEQNRDVARLADLIQTAVFEKRRAA